MKRGAYLINPSRPQLVDSEAALQAVLCGQLAGYGVDERVTHPRFWPVSSRANPANRAHRMVFRRGHGAGSGAWVENLIALAEAL